MAEDRRNVPPAKCKTAPKSIVSRPESPRLPVELIQSVHRSIVDQARRELDDTDDLGDESYRWRGHRVHVVDGTSDSMPDAPELRGRMTAFPRAAGRAWAP